MAERKGESEAVLLIQKIQSGCHLCGLWAVCLGQFNPHGLGFSSLKMGILTYLLFRGFKCIAYKMLAHFLGHKMH